MQFADAHGQPISLRAGHDALRISAGSFSQGNALLHDTLLRSVLGLAGRGLDLLELCSGAGFFTLELARRFERVVAVETAPPALADLRFNLASADLRNVEVVEGTAEEACAAMRPGRFDTIVLDPPRVGLGEGATRAMARLGAERIVYLSCDPATLARDLTLLLEAGYRIEDMSAFDLFPQTPHVEALAGLVLG